jgi:GT2 family glycosyltransferase
MMVSIIIVNYNSLPYLRKCIASIRRHTSIAHEIIVVDNASPNGEAMFLETIFPDITVIRNKTNRGFAAANNLGFIHALGDVILFLNPDTELITPAIDQMTTLLHDTLNCGVVGCTLLNEDLTIQTSCIQTFPTIVNQVLDSDWLRSRWPHSTLWGTAPLFSNANTSARVEAISGACMLIAREVFTKAGQFSEDYFMYAEDVDLCYKVRQRGCSNYYLGPARVIHYGGKSSNPAAATRMKWRAVALFCDKHGGSLYGLAFRLTIAFTALMRLIFITFANIIRPFLGTPGFQPSVSDKWRLVLNAVLTYPTRTRSRRIA